MAAAMLAGGAIAWVLATADAAASQERAPERREFAVTARSYAYQPARLEVLEGDIVRVTFRAEDIAHSFTIDAYRIAKRAPAGQSITFEFHADQVGSFPIYCNLALDERCRDMHGELVVRRR